MELQSIVDSVLIHVQELASNCLDKATTGAFVASLTLRDVNGLHKIHKDRKKMLSKDARRSV